MTAQVRAKFMTTIYLEVRQIQALRAVSKRTRIPMAVLIRDAVDLVLAAHDQEVGATHTVPVFGHPDIPPKMDPPSLSLPFAARDAK